MAPKHTEERDLVLVKISELVDVQNDIDSILHLIDELVRVRPLLIRARRILKEMDPENTPIRSVSPPDLAYRQADNFSEEYANSHKFWPNKKRP